VSRSHWAWAKGCELVGAAVQGARRLGRNGVLRERLGAKRPVGTASSIPTLTWIATAAILIAAVEPAHAQASATRGAKPPIAHPVSLTLASTTRTTTPPHSTSPAHSASPARGRLLAPGAGYTAAHGSRAVRTLQRRLAGLGDSPGAIDGRYGPRTEQAVMRFQAARRLHVDGIAGPQTTAALASANHMLVPGDGYVPGGSGQVRSLQRHLAQAGFPPGPIDGKYGPRTEQAVTRFQAARHLHIDGIAGPQTLNHLQPAAHRPAAHPRTAGRARPSTPPTPTPPTSSPRPPATTTAAMVSAISRSAQFRHGFSACSPNVRTGKVNGTGSFCRRRKMTFAPRFAQVRDIAVQHLRSP